MRIILVCILAFIFPGILFAQNAQKQKDPTVKILFIGNSFLHNNNLPEIVRGLVEADHINADIDSKISLGQSVNFHYHDKYCWSKIKSKKWDYIVIQDNMRYYYDAKGVIDSFDYRLKKVMSTPLLATNIKFQDSIKQLIPGVKIIYFAGWEQSGGDQLRFPGDSTKKLIRRILVNVKYLNDQPGVHNVIAPVGVAYIKSIEMKPFFDQIPAYNDTARYLYDHDGRHPGNAGSYLAACVVFSTIFHRSAIGLNDFDKDVPKDMASFLKEIAWESVLDSFSYTNLATVTPEIKKFKKGHNILYTSKKYESYQWYNDEHPIPGANSFEYNAGDVKNEGNFWVETTDKKGDKYWSFPYCVN